MWSLQTPWHELMIRSFCIFTFLLVLTRFWGKKHIGELAPFDFVLLLIISEAVQSALIPEDTSLTAGMIVITTFVLISLVLGRLTFKFRWAERWIDGTPRIIVRNGKINRDLMEKEEITEQELHEALRQEGVLGVKDVKQATIETNGKISVVKNYQ